MAMENDGRLDYLERSLEDHRQDARELKEAIRHLGQKMDERFGAVETRFLSVDTHSRVSRRASRVSTPAFRVSTPAFRFSRLASITWIEK